MNLIALSSLLSLDLERNDRALMGHVFHTYMFWRFQEISEYFHIYQLIFIYIAIYLRLEKVFFAFYLFPVTCTLPVPENNRK